MGPDRLMSAAELAALCEELVWQLDLRPPLDPHEMCRRLAKTRGRKITVVARDLGGEVSIGHLKAGLRSDRIGHDQNAPAPLAAHVIFHEVLHIVRDHLSGPGDRICGTNFGEAPEDVSLYADWTEWEAETGATYLSEMSRRRSRPRVLSRNARPADRAIAAAFGLIPADRQS